MNKNPLVSVIVPIYGVEPYIEKCARSLFEQSLENMEFIFVNDCTPDKSVEILRQVIEEYPRRYLQIQIIEHEENRGLAMARNSGLLIAKGEYIIHCDSDDWVELDMYEKMYEKALEKNADIVICDYYAEYSNKRIYHIQREPREKEEYLIKILQGCLHNGMWNKLVRRELYQHLSFWYKEGVDMWEDVSIMPRLVFYAENIVSMHKAFYHYSQVNINAYTKCWKTESLQNVIDVVNVIESFLLENKNGRYNLELLYLKLRAKYCLLRYSSGKQRNVYRNLYSEADSLVFSHSVLPIHDKIIIWCWLHSMDWGAAIILSFIERMKRWLR